MLCSIVAEDAKKIETSSEHQYLCEVKPQARAALVQRCRSSVVQWLPLPFFLNLSSQFLLSSLYLNFCSGNCTRLILLSLSDHTVNVKPSLSLYSPRCLFLEEKWSSDHSRDPSGKNKWTTLYIFQCLLLLSHRSWKTLKKVFSQWYSEDIHNPKTFTLSCIKKVVKSFKM